MCGKKMQTHSNLFGYITLLCSTLGFAGLDGLIGLKGDIGMPGFVGDRGPPGLIGETGKLPKKKK